MFIKILLKYILGYVRITVEGYYIERFINICTTSKILIWNLKREKGVRLYLNIGIKDFFEAVKIAKKLKCKVKKNICYYIISCYNFDRNKHKICLEYKYTNRFKYGNDWN